MLHEPGFLKKSSSVLSGSMANPALVSQSKHTAYRARRSLVTPSQVSAQANRTPSSTYIPKEELFQPRIRCRSGDV